MTNLGEYARVDCPCSQFLGSLAGTALRFCGGDFDNGAYWTDYIDISLCVTLMSTMTSNLCQAAAVSHFSSNIYCRGREFHNFCDD